MEEIDYEKCKRSKKGQSSAANIMELLPYEVLLHILSRLPLISLLQSKLVCRAWRNLTQDPLLISNHFSHMRRLTDSDPSFIVQTSGAMSDQLCLIDFSFYSESGMVISKMLPKLPMLLYMVDSCNGLLCMRSSSRGSTYICNPFTGLYIELPRLVMYLGHLGFGFDPISKQYKVIQMVLGRNLRRRDLNPTVPPLVQSDVQVPPLVQSDVQILTINDSPTWRSLGMIPYRLMWRTSKVNVNGRLHWLSKPNKYTGASLIVSLVLATEQFQEVSKPDCCGSDRCFHQLMVIRGCLSAGAYHDNEQLEIWVMKQYGVKESWVREFNIGAYLPQSLNQKDILLFDYSKRRFPNKFVRVHCMLRSGEILLEYGGRALVLYNSDDGTFKELTLSDMPYLFRIIGHVSSLNWLDTPVC